MGSHHGSRSHGGHHGGGHHGSHHSSGGHHSSGVSHSSRHRHYHHSSSYRSAKGLSYAQNTESPFWYVKYDRKVTGYSYTNDELTAASGSNFQERYSSDTAYLIVHDTEKFQYEDLNDMKEERVCYNGSSYHGSSFTINMQDNNLLESLSPDAKKFIENNSKPVKILFETLYVICAVFLFIISVMLATENISYELIIPIFENMSMSDAAFEFIDNSIYYGQALAPIIIFFSIFVAVGICSKGGKFKGADIVKEEVAEYIDNHYPERVSFDDYLTQIGISPVATTDDLSTYLNAVQKTVKICPFCSATCTDNSSYCSSCGASIINVEPLEKTDNM